MIEDGGCISVYWERGVYIQGWDGGILLYIGWGYIGSMGRGKYVKERVWEGTRYGKDEVRHEEVEGIIEDFLSLTDKFWCVSSAS